MSPAELDEYFAENPNTAFRITMASGNAIDVPDTRSLIIEGFMLRVTYFAAEGRITRSRHRMLSIPNINMIEPTKVAGPPGGNGEAR